MNIKQIEDAIISAISEEFPQFDQVDRVGCFDRGGLDLPACFLQSDGVDLSAYDNPDSTVLSAQFSILIVYKNAERASLMEHLAEYIEFVNRNQWGLGITEAFFTGATPVELAPEQKDLYIWSIRFSHEFSV